MISLINPKTNQEFTNVPPKLAAKYLGVSEQFVYEGLKQGILPFGNAVRTGKTDKWSFLIPVGRLKKYASGFDMGAKCGE